MAFENNIITVIGNLTDDPDLRFTPGGAAVCSVRLATNRRWRDRDGREQEETTFVTANAWRDLAENVAQSLTKGDRAVVIGRLRIRSYEDRDGQTRWVTEIEADEIAPSLRWARAKPEKTRGPSATTGNGNDGGGTPQPADMEDVPF